MTVPTMNPVHEYMAQAGRITQWLLPETERNVTVQHATFVEESSNVRSFAAIHGASVQASEFDGVSLVKATAPSGADSTLTLWAVAS